MIVPFAAGGPVDVMARLIGQPLARIIGQPIVIENRGGASGGIGSKLVANADPDGYTLLCGNISSLIVQPILTRNRDCGHGKVLVPVARLSQNVEVLVVHPDFPAQSVRELVAYAKANPNKLNYGSGGQGNISHLAAELFRLRDRHRHRPRALQGRLRSRSPASLAARFTCILATSAACCR